ncbi:SdpI family protein [Arthrobacter sp. CP30]
MDEATTPLIVAMVFFILIGILFAGFSSMLRKDRISRNGAIGIRTKATMSSDEAWSRGQKAGAPWVLAGSIAAVVATIAGLTALLITGFEPSQVVNATIILPGFALVIAMLITSGIAASKAAKNQHN